jgi:S-adenosyl-L-methionine hydrolase (adenosine-forming)
MLCDYIAFLTAFGITFFPMALPRMPIITLLTDYGTKDHFVASMKAVILSISPQVQIVDISHDVPAHDILEAGFVLRSCFSYFPTRTIHVVVVDPTVGSPRKAIVVATDNHYFVAPDNGVLSLIYDAEPVTTVVEIAAEHLMLPEISKTFHGRDIFAPAAAWLARGTDMLNFGDTITEYTKLTLPKAKLTTEGKLKGSVLHVDRFGNLITNISRQDLDAAREKIPGNTFKVTIGKQEIDGLKNYFAEGQKGEIVALFGSTNLLEIAQNQGSASRTLGVGRGAEASISLK